MTSTAPATRDDGARLAGVPAPAGLEPDLAGCASEVDTEVAAPDDESLARLAKAIGHPARVTILRLLAARKTCITGDVVAELPLAQSTVSEHLRILREAGLVQATPDGNRIAYCVSPTGLALLKRGIAEL